MFIKAKKSISLSFFKRYLLGLVLFLYIKICLLILLILFLCIFATVNASCLFENFPSFSFESHDGTFINNESIKDKDIKIIIYGSPDALNNNRKQLDIVLDWLKTSNKTKHLLYTIDFSSYPKMIRGIIKNQMKKNSKDLDIMIYADWNGTFNQHFQLEKSQVHLFLLLEKSSVNHYELFSFSTAEKTLNKLSKITW